MNAAFSTTSPLPVVRPPWPDELPRLGDAFPALALEQLLHLRVLAVPATATTPERLVGLAALGAPAGDKTAASLLFAVRPRFAATSAATDLLAEIVAVAREQKFAAIDIPAPANAAHRAASLHAAGFAPVNEENILRLLLKI